jgi:hypothetical protein
MREKVIAEYHDLLMNDESLTSELFARLKGGMRAMRLLYGQRELGISLRPHFLSRRQYELLLDRPQILVGAFDKVAAAMLADPPMMDRVGIRERERRLALIHPGYAQPAINTRLDAFVYGDQIKFVEVPWTRRVSERKTFHHGREIDLIEYIRNHRNDFILKSNDDYGGHGIYFGDRATESEWDETIANVLNHDYVVQERVELQTEEFPIFNEREWGLQQMFVDTNPFIFRGAVDGAMVRLSDSPIVNVTSGGGETGFFVLEDD